MLAQGVKGLREGAHGGNNKKRARYIGLLLAVAAVVTREFSLGAATDVDSFGELVAHAQRTHQGHLHDRDAGGESGRRNRALFTLQQFEKLDL